MGLTEYQQHKISQKQKSVSRIYAKVEPRCKNLECRDPLFGSNPKASVVLCDYSVSLVRKFLGLTRQGSGFMVRETVSFVFG